VEWVREPLVPVTVTVTVPAAVNVQESVDVPEPPVTLVGVNVQAELSEVRATVPVKPFTGEIVIVEVPAVFTATVTLVGAAVTVKSGTPVMVKATVAGCDSVPDVPVTVTVTLPVVVKVQDSVELPEPPMRVVGVSVQALLSDVSVTSPVNPFNGDIAIVEVPGDPTTTVTLEGVAVIEKSATRFTVYATLVEWEREPLVPVTVTVTVPAEVKVHDRTEVPEPPVTLAADRVHAVLSLVSATSPVNPFNGEIVIVDMPADPTLTVTEAGLADIVKSGAPVTVKVTVAEWVSEPLAPVTVTTTLPVAVKVQDRVDVPEPPVTLAGVKVHAELSEVRATLPVKLFSGEIVIVEVPAELTITGTVVGLAEIVKSGVLVTVYVTVTEWVSDPLVPVTVTTMVPVAVKVQESVEVPEPPVMVAALKAHAELSEVSATLPVNPLTGEMVMVEVPAELTTTDSVVGLAAMVKSGRPVTVNATVAEWVSEPLVPVTVTVTDPVAVNVQDRVDVPEPPVTLDGVSVQAVLSDVSATVLVNPFRGETLMVEVPGELTATVTAVGDAAIVKSGVAVTV
jgi:hypothetical protein